MSGSPQLAVGSRVRVRDDWPETRGRVHIRTPHYVRGRTGTVVRCLGDFPDPEQLAFARPARILPLYHVLFEQPQIWLEGCAGDQLLVEIYGSWLEPS